MVQFLRPARDSICSDLEGRTSGLYLLDDHLEKRRTFVARCSVLLSYWDESIRLDVYHSVFTCLAVHLHIVECVNGRNVSLRKRLGYQYSYSPMSLWLYRKK